MGKRTLRLAHPHHDAVVVDPSKRFATLSFFWAVLLCLLVIESAAFTVVVQQGTWHHRQVAAADPTRGADRRTRHAFPCRMSSSSSPDPSVQDPSTTAAAEPAAATDDIGKMTVKEIKAELNERRVSFHDCFDRDSLAVRLGEMRSGQQQALSDINKANPTPPESKEKDRSAQSSSTSSSMNNEEPTINAKASSKAPVIDLDLESVKKMSVKELRAELASRNVGWKTFVDKDDLIRAVQHARQEAAHFSSTGLLRPGHVGDLTADQVRDELDGATNKSPMLLDVYATWCGPCQMMSPILVQASHDLADVRFAKVDSDRYPELAGAMRVQGLPTLILFDNGAEVARLEGALMKDQLVAWVRDKLNSSK
jgi:thioredoxin